MISYIYVSANGCLHGAGQVQPELVDYLKPPPGCSVITGVNASVVQGAYYDFVSGNVMSAGSAPSPHHVFDYTTKTWEDPRTLEDFKDTAYKKIEEWRSQQENQTFQFIHAGRHWDAGLITRQRIQPVLGLSQLPEGFFWTDAANVDVPVTMASLQALAQAHEEALVIKGFEIHAQQRAMKNDVDVATSKEAVEAIVIGL